MSETSKTTLAWRDWLGHRLPAGSLGRYLLVGGFNTAFGYALYVAFTALLMPHIHAGYVVASVLANVVAITVSFVNHKVFVFKTKGHWLREWSRCLVVYGSTMVAGLVALPPLVWACTRLTGDAASAPYIAGAAWTLVNVLWNFVGHKHFAFASPR
jgi:putative flippase GtrA